MVGTAQPHVSRETNGADGRGPHRFPSFCPTRWDDSDAMNAREFGRAMMRNFNPSFPSGGTALLVGESLRAHADLVFSSADGLDLDAALALPSVFAHTVFRRVAIIYVRSGISLSYFFRTIHPRLPSPYVLVAGSTDSCNPPRKYEHLLDDPKLLAYFARNPAARHPKLIGVPVGPEANGGQHNASAYLRALASASLVPRIHRLFVESFNLARSGAAVEDRRAAVHAASRLTRTYSPGRVDAVGWMYGAASSRFFLSPLGNGLDCSRTSKGLLLGSIPVLSRKSNRFASTGIYDDLPVLVVNDWTQLTDSLLDETYARLLRRFREWPREQGFAEYWVARLYAAQRRGQQLLDSGELRCSGRNDRRGKGDSSWRGYNLSASQSESHSLWLSRTQVACRRRRLREELTPIA